MEFSSLNINNAIVQLKHNSIGMCVVVGCLVGYGNNSSSIVNTLE
jgi:hypothetical protein